MVVRNFVVELHGSFGVFGRCIGVVLEQREAREVIVSAGVAVVLLNYGCEFGFRSRPVARNEKLHAVVRTLSVERAGGDGKKENKEWAHGKLPPMAGPGLPYGDRKPSDMTPRNKNMTSGCTRHRNDV